MTEIDLATIKEAAKRIAPYLWPTPLLPSKKLQTFLNWQAPVFFKCETLQYTGSFKVRGAANKILKLLEEGKKPSRLIASSAGNHAQAVAFVAQKLGIPATIVMPEGAPLVKINATEGYGAKVELFGALYDHAFEKAWKLHQETPNSVFVHPYEDLDIIAGQGSLGLEIDQQLKDNGIVDAAIQVVIPIGGGGLFSGTATALKNLRAQTKCFGVVSQAAPSMALSFAEGHIVEATGTGRTLADGLAVKKVSKLNFEFIQSLADEVVVVDESDLASAIFYLMSEMKLVVEGAGAAGLAALLGKKLTLDPAKPLVFVLCGGNIDMQRASNIIERALLEAGRWVNLEIAIEDRPGELAKVTKIISEQRANVLEVEHDRISNHSKPGQTLLKLHLECRGENHVAQLIEALVNQKYIVERR